MNSTTILLIEDNLDDELLTRHLLKKQRLGNRILAIDNGAEALDFLFCRNAHAGRDPNDLPQLVLLDINLPKINGLEVLRQIRANPQTHFLPVAMLTSSQDEDDLFESYRSGAVAFLRKPIDFARFTEIVAQLGLYVLVVDKVPPE